MGDKGDAIILKKLYGRHISRNLKLHHFGKKGMDFFLLLFYRKVLLDTVQFHSTEPGSLILFKL